MTAERALAPLPAAHDVAPGEVDPATGRRRPRPSATRGASLSRASRVRELNRGNVNAWRHGVFAQVAAAPDVATEVALTLAAHPGLDPIVDRRLVELLATTRVSRQRALLAMATEGLTPVLTSYDARMAPLEERLERTVVERERLRLAERPPAGEGYRVGQYRPEGTR